MTKQITLNTTTKKIAAIVVTHNRKELLVDLIESLQSQSRKFDQIYVVDNYSNDGTEIYLNYINKKYKNITVIRNNINTGGSGGFYTGLKNAYDDGYDWFWLIDDDVEAFPNALEDLLKYSFLSECIHGRRQNQDGTPFFWQVKFFESLGYWLPVPGNVFRQSPIFETNTGCFEGMFISRRIVEKIGFPDPRFFITWDDAIYGWLASKVTNIFYINHFVLKRKRPRKDINLGIRHLSSCSDLYRYYFIKNRPIIKEYLIKKNSYSPLLFFIGTLLIFFKELTRIILIDRSFNSVLAIYKGFKDQETNLENN